MANLNIKLTMDEEVVSDFRECFNDYYEKAANCILHLEENPSNTESINEVLRALHTIKGNASMCQLEDLTSFSHAAEEVVVAVLQGNLTFDPMLGEVILLVLDKIKEVSEDIFHGRDIEKELLEQTENLLCAIKDNPADHLRKKEANIISMLSGESVDENYLETYNLVQLSTVSQVTEKPLPDAKSAQLDYFKELAYLLEKKSKNWDKRIERTLNLALEVNNLLGTPEDPVQLHAAVYLHDFGHAFLDEILLEDTGKLTDEQITEMQRHPELSAKLLSYIDGWKDAQEIILQHHEKWDGSGYPAGIDGETIRTGAQILAVIDAFESMTHYRPDRKHKRSILRAMTEINNYSGSQFSPHVTSVFNNVVRETLVKK